MADISDTIRALEDLAAGGGAGDAARQVAELVNQIGGLGEATTSSRAAITALRRELLELVKTEDQRRNLGNEVVDSINRQITVLEQLRAKIFDLNAAYDTQRERIRGLMGINSSWSTSTLGVMTKIVAEGKGVGAAFASITREMKGTVSRADMLTSSFVKVQELGTAAFAAIVKQTFDLATGLDRASVQLARTTGAGEQYSSMVVRLESDLYKFGVTAEDAGRAVGALYSGMTGFTQMSATTRKTVSESVSILQRMGISAETSARNMDFMNRSMGMTGTQAASMNQQLFAAAQQLGISTTKMLEDFGSIGPQLIKFGQEATRVYMNLQSVAKNTGIEIQRLLQITEQFDKFDSAAESVGRLNAILGGPYLNTIQMVTTTDPTKRLQMMAGAVKDAGMTFDSMSYYMRQATASAMGLQDVNELAMIMRGRIDLLGSSTGQTGADIEKMMAQTQRYNEVADEMRQVMRSIAISMQPMIGRLKDMAEWMQENAGTVQFLVGTFAGLKIINGLTTSIAMFNLALGATAGAAGAASVALSGLAGAAAIGGLAYVLLQKRNSPTLLEGTQMFGSSLQNVASSANLASKQIGLMQSPLDAAHGKVVRFGSALQGVSAEQQGLLATARAVSQIGATIEAVPERKTVKFTTLMDKVNQSGRIANANTGVVQNTAAAMYRPPPPPVQVRQPIKVALEMDSRSIGSQVVDVMLS